MEHPTAIDGSRFRYERDALAQWVAVHGTVPHPPHPVRATLDDLRPDDALRDEIRAWRRAREALERAEARARALGASAALSRGDAAEPTTTSSSSGSRPFYTPPRSGGRAAGLARQASWSA